MGSQGEGKESWQGGLGTAVVQLKEIMGEPIRRFLWGLTGRGQGELAGRSGRIFCAVKGEKGGL